MDPLEKQENERARAALEAYLGRHGLKHTRQREAILSAFLGSKGHVTSEDLCEMVRRDHPDIGAATVYRTLKLFCDAEIANAIHFRGGVTLYEHQRTHHDHLICVGCGDVVEFESDTIEKTQQEVARSHGYLLTNHRHDLYGYCPACREKHRGQG